MAGLSAALNYALSGLTVSAGQTAVTSRNVTFANEADYSRRTTVVSTLPDGAAVLASTMRTADARLLAQKLTAASGAAGQQVILDSLTTLSSTVGDVSEDGSIAAGISDLSIKLSDYEANPSSQTLAAAVALSAGTVAQSLNGANTTVQKARLEADQAIAASANNINALLQRFQVANQTVIKTDSDQAARNDALDQRDAILQELSQEIGIRTVMRSPNDMAIYTDSGVTLFEATPRTVTFQTTGVFTAGTVGNAVYADGVRITGDSAPMATNSGKLQAYVTVRDKIAPQYQSQIDEVARGLVETFRESDQSGAGLPDVAGLFTWSGGPAIPATGTISNGIAGTITVNPVADATVGGNSLLIRDGGIGGAAYTYNTTGAAGFQGRISDLIKSLNTARSFDPAAGIGSSGTVAEKAMGSAGWLEQQRSTADASVTASTAKAQRTSEALQRVTGVNIDEEMTRLLDLERAYQSSAKVMSIVGQMMQQLVSVI